LVSGQRIMKKIVGQFMRLGGLLVEMLGVLAVMKGNEGLFATKLQLPGFEPVPLAWIGIALGFVLWLVGTVLFIGRDRLVSRPDRKSKRLCPDDFEFRLALNAKSR
jgi:hypothetical protein